MPAIISIISILMRIDKAMLEQVKIRIDEKTIELLKSKIGKTIVKIGYVVELSFSVATVIIFDDSSALKIINSAIVCGDLGEEYPHFSAEEIKIENDIAYGDEKYEYYDYNLKIKGYKSITDYITWSDKDGDSYFDIESGIVAEGEDNKKLILFAFDSLAEAIAIYTDSEKFEKDHGIRRYWDIDNKSAKYKRIYKDI